MLAMCPGRTAGLIGIRRCCCRLKACTVMKKVWRAACRRERESLTSLAAASERPCAWLPAEEVMTPRASCSGDRLAILLKAPRSLNENTCAGNKDTLFASSYPSKIISLSEGAPRRRLAGFGCRQTDHSGQCSHITVTEHALLHGFPLYNAYKDGLCMTAHRRQTERLPVVGPPFSGTTCCSTKATSQLPAPREFRSAQSFAPQ